MEEMMTKMMIAMMMLRMNEAKDREVRNLGVRCWFLCG